MNIWENNEFKKLSIWTTNNQDQKVDTELYVWTNDRNGNHLLLCIKKLYFAIYKTNQLLNNFFALFWLMNLYISHIYNILCHIYIYYDQSHSEKVNGIYNIK